MLKIIRIVLLTIADTFKVMKALRKHGADVYYSYAKRWSEKLLNLANVYVNIIGSENIDANETYIFAANHSDLFDIPVLHVALKNNFRIIYKKELEKIPVFGKGLAKSPYIGIVRDNPHEALKSIEKAIEAAKEGTSVLVFPEGTRTKTGKLGAFKRGGFMIAARAGKPIVPIYISGTFGLSSSSKFNIKSGNVKVTIGNPITKIPSNSTEEKELMNEVYQELQKMSKIF